MLSVSVKALALSAAEVATLSKLRAHASIRCYGDDETNRFVNGVLVVQASALISL
jgi:hypothetical protein